MNTYLHAQTKVRKITYVCHQNGDIDPYVQIIPLVGPSGEEVSQFPLLHMQVEELLYPAAGDTISIEINQDPKVKPILRIVEKSAAPRRVAQVGLCPICGDILHSPQNPLSIGRCWNRNCQGSLYFNLVHYLGNIGMPINESTIRVLRCIAGRNSIYSLPGVYRLQPEDLIFVYTSPYDVINFLTALHSLRGRIGPDTLIRALRIPEWTESDYAAFSSFCIAKDVPLSDILVIVLSADPTEGQCNWPVLQKFFEHQTNFHILHELSFILEK